MKYYVDFITKNATNKLTPFEKIKMIIRLVRQNRVLIIESGFSSSFLFLFRPFAVGFLFFLYRKPDFLPGLFICF